ncbi:MAG TPA: hypoxanthine-guanine phosphoribosyltransferase [Rudaea sp.]|nr:hypoxanthine-guanine phosphoribosyltransferase [Rudaea sp.]
MTRPALAEALKAADLLHDRAKLETSIARMGRAIDAALAGEVPLYLSVMHGGLIFSGALALAVSTDLEFDYVHATRYRGATQGGDLHWLRKPAVALTGRTVLLADDILDEGYTLRAIRDWCIAQGARRVLIAVMCQKRHDRTAPGIRADFCGVEVPDRYVFGFGMDYHEQGRNLPGIYALKE